MQTEGPQKTEKTQRHRKGEMYTDMYGEIKVRGIVLSAMPVGEYDRRVSILTCEKGRISAFAAYARRPKSMLRACTQPFVYGIFTLREGRDSYNLVSCDEPNFFDELKTNLDATYYAMYFCEMMEYLTREGCDEKEQVKLLYVSFNAILRKQVPIELIRRIFELRALANFGEAPAIFECASCGKKETGRIWHFDRFKSRILCDNCRINMGNDAGSFETLSEAARYAMHYCITVAPQKLYSFELTENVQREFDCAVSDYVALHVDRKMKSLEVIEVEKRT